MTSRFSCPSVSLTLGHLLTRRALSAGLALALGLHIALVPLQSATPQQEVAKPLTTKFVKRQPRLTKPLEMKKRPEPKRRQIQMKMVTVAAKASERESQSSVRSAQLAGSLARPRVEMKRVLRSPEEVLG